MAVPNRRRVTWSGRRFSTDMTLHGAIGVILMKHKGTAHLETIAEEITSRRLWRRPTDGLYPDRRQISARVARYPRIFERLGDGFVRIR